MFNIHSVEIDWGGRPLKLETGKIARQSDGAVVATYGETAVLAVVAASAALTLSGAPFKGPIGAARVGFINDEYVLNPTLDEMADTQLDLVVAGTADAVLMVESEAKELNEDIMLGAVMFGHRHFQPVIKAIIDLAEKAAKEPREVKVVDESAIEKEMLGLIEQELRAAHQG